jgi:hypothetical protein
VKRLRYCCCVGRETRKCQKMLLTLRHWSKIPVTASKYWFCYSKLLRFTFTLLCLSSIGNNLVSLTVDIAFIHKWLPLTPLKYVISYVRIVQDSRWISWGPESLVDTNLLGQTEVIRGVDQIVVIVWIRAWSKGCVD